MGLNRKYFEYKHKKKLRRRLWQYFWIRNFLSFFVSSVLAPIKSLMIQFWTFYSSPAIKCQPQNANYNQFKWIKNELKSVSVIFVSKIREWHRTNGKKSLELSGLSMASDGGKLLNFNGNYCANYRRKATINGGNQNPADSLEKNFHFPRTWNHVIRTFFLSLFVMLMSRTWLCLEFWYFWTPFIRCAQILRRDLQIFFLSF